MTNEHLLVLMGKLAASGLLVRICNSVTIHTKIEPIKDSHVMIGQGVGVAAGARVIGLSRSQFLQFLGEAFDALEIERGEFDELAASCLAPDPKQARTLAVAFANVVDDLVAIEPKTSVQ